jgi:hypothetical protein
MRTGKTGDANDESQQVHEEAREEAGFSRQEIRSQEIQAALA